MTDATDAAGPPVLAVVGLGCIGGSIALRAKSLGVRVAGFDLPGPLDLAISLGIVDDALPSFEAAATASLLVLAVPPETTCRYLEALAEHPPAGIVIDVASVKSAPSRAGANVPTYVPTHPIAGSQRSGPGAADEELFVDRTWVVVPQGSPEAIARAKALITAMGARIVDLDAETHDRIVATTSHLPQVVSVVLAAAIGGTIESPLALALAGPGLASMLRLGGSSFALWREVLAANAESVVADVRSFAKLLNDFAESLEARDLATLEARFAQAAQATRLVQTANARASALVAPTPSAPLRPAAPASAGAALP